MKKTEFGEVFLDVIEDTFQPNPKQEGLDVLVNGGLVTEEFLVWYRQSLGIYKDTLETTAIGTVKPKHLQQAELEETEKPEESKIQDAIKNLDNSIEWADARLNKMQTQAKFLGGKPGESDPNSRIIRDWGLVKGGVEVPVSYEAMIGLGAKMLDSFFNWVVFEAGSPKKENLAQSESS